MAEFASWGVDWVKVDGCGEPPNLTQSKSVIWNSAIQQVGYPVGLEMSISGNPGDPNNLTYGALINDTDDGGQQVISFSSTFASILVALDEAMSPGGILGYRQQIGPGHFSDAMIVSESTNASNPCPTNTTRQAMAICALLAAPVQFDGPPSAANMSYITNGEMLNGILRDPLVIRCSVVSSNTGLEILAKPLQNGSVAVGFVNRTGTANSPISVSWPAIGLASDAVCAVHDPWRGADIGFATNAYTASVPADDLSVLIFRPQSPSLLTQSLTVSGATNLITFGTTSTPPASTNPVAWISVTVSGDTNQYRLPLMK
jgi:alpha-galactosidase